MATPLQLTAAEATENTVVSPTSNRKGTPTRLPTIRRAQSDSGQQNVKPVSALGELSKPVAARAPNTKTESYAGWLPSGTSAATSQVANQALGRADQEFRVGAWLSAETSAWEAMRWTAEAIDQSNRQSGRAPNHDTATLATSSLRVAKQAIFEARDFAKTAESQSPQAIARIARSHQTDVLNDNPNAGLSATDASDIYLDFARTRLAAIASHSVQAAQAMDLLAAIYLRRSDSRTLPSATALCLRRAAIQGQPANASLAANLGVHLNQVGLHREAQWALEHSMSIDPNARAADALATLHRKSGRHDQASSVIASVGKAKATYSRDREIRVPEITELSPDEFAALSKSVVWTDDSSDLSGTESVRPQTSATLASARIQPDQPIQYQPTELADEPSTVDSNKPNPLGWFKNSWKRITD